MKSILLSLILLFALNTNVYAQKYSGDATNATDSAIIWAQEVLKHYPSNPKSEDIEKHILAKGFLSQLYIAQGNHARAEKTLAELLAFVEKQNNKQAIATYGYFLGSVCSNLNKLDEALIHFNKSVTTALEIKNYNTAAQSQLSIATIYNSQGRFKEAETASMLIVKYAELNNQNNFQLGSGWHTLASAHYSQKKYNDALNAFKQAGDYYAKNNDIKFCEIVQSSIAYILNEMGQTEPAIAKAANPQTAVNTSHQFLDTIPAVGKSSYEAIKLQKMISDYNAEEKRFSLEVLQQDYHKRQAEVFQQRIWYISGLSLLVVILLVLLYARQRQQTKVERIARNAKQKELEYAALQQEVELKMIKKYIDGLESERERISKELHDGVCNDLLAIEMALKNDCADDTMIKQLSQSRDNVRNISHELLPPQFQYATIDEILSDYIGRFKSESIAINYTANLHNDWDSLSRDIAFAIYRITQESVSNSIKHSGASKIEITLSKSDEDICILIADNGTGFHKNSKTKGIGLQTVHDRVKSVAGTLSIDTSVTGTTIKATFKT